MRNSWETGMAEIRAVKRRDGRCQWLNSWQYESTRIILELLVLASELQVIEVAFGRMCGNSMMT
jgi:hypothetical protein